MFNLPFHLFHSPASPLSITHSFFLLCSFASFFFILTRLSICAYCGASQGLIDHSGMRIKMVSKLRRHDAAIMELGLEYSDKMAIPPGVLAFPLSGYCIAECTQTVINGFYHLPQSYFLYAHSVRLSPLACAI